MYSSYIAKKVSSTFPEVVAQGLISGYSTIDKFGYNPVVATDSDPEDIWEGGGIYPFSTTADIISLSSSDDSDTQDIIIYGLTLDGAMVTQTKTLAGNTRVVLDTPLWRVYRMENEGSTDLAGIVYCYSGTESAVGVPSGASVEKARIDNGNNQTLMAVYTIPAGKVGFLYRGEVGMAFTGVLGAGTVYMRGVYQSRRPGGVFKIKKQLSCVATGSSNYADRRSFPDTIPAMTDIKLTAYEVSDSMGVWGAFDILLVDENQLDKPFLQAIGQPGY